MTKIMIISGLARSGKDTLADKIVDIAKSKNLTATKVAFAKPIKDVACILFNMTHEELEKHKEKPISWLNNITPRKFLQGFGTEFVRESLDTDFWILKMQQEIAKTNVDIFIIPDCRFENELQIKKLYNDVVTVKVVRNIREPISNTEHKSELGLDDSLFDIVFENNGTLNDISTFAKRIVI